MAGQGEWGGYDDPGERRWWMPIVVGLVALLLLGVLIFGGWLILRAGDGPTAPGTPSPSPSATARPTSAAPTTAAPSPDPTTAAAVPMPPLVGLTEQEAQDRLDELDIDYRLRYRPSDRPAGTVIETDPPAGTPVPSDERVTVVIAEEPDPAPGTSGPGVPTSPVPNG